MRGVFEVPADDLRIRDDRDGGTPVPSLSRADHHDGEKGFYTARMPDPAHSAAPARETNMTRIYVLVVIVEIITLAGIYWMQQVFA